MAKKGLYANIHAKRKRIAAGSGERMRKPGAPGAPTAEAFRDSEKTVKKKRKKKKGKKSAMKRRGLAIANEQMRRGRTGY
jgi:hypothetical protein